MKTPTNFIPIIGPLYADDLQSNRNNWRTNELDSEKVICHF